jgi:hypothetical protein
LTAAWPSGVVRRCPSGDGHGAGFLGSSGHDDRGSKLHKTTTFGAHITGQYHFFNFLLKSTSFGAWRYKLDQFSSNHVLIAVLTIGVHL